MAKQVGAWTAFYCPREEAFLFARRSPTVNNPFLWNFFGGQLDAGESPKRAAMRELREEAGVKLAKRSLIPIGHTRLRGLAYTGAERDLHFFLVLCDDLFQPKLNDEHSEFRWFRKDHLPLSINRATAIAVENGLVKKAKACARKHREKVISF